ncbi:MAG: hypothetical protein LUB59_05310 [Candidatus Gastranaerophilales bacterium]|nr:hypothetical protein [Candidatus Gastranaerophilales bacterium]
MKKNILIVGNSAKESAMAHILSKQFNVYAAPGNDGMKEFATIVDIRENNVVELLNFALENDINFTVVCSETAIKSDIYDLFNDNGLMIFSPTSSAAQFTISKSTAKKMFYKLRLPTPGFGVFEKKNLALDYLKNCEMPVVIKTDNHKLKNRVMVCPSSAIAKACIEDYFFSGETKVIIEDYVYGINFSFYVITDGYKALPVGSVEDYKFSLDGGGGVLTDGMGACSPFTRFTYDHEDYMMNEIVYPVINYLSEGLKPYMGILGFDGILTPEGDIAIIECNSFLRDHDAQGILSLLENDIYKLMEACAIGSFSDDYNLLDFKDEFAVSCVLSSGQVKNEVIRGLDDLQEGTIIAHINTRQNEYTEYETQGGRTLVITSIAKTISRAAANLYNEIDAIEFRGKYYRKDLCKLADKW